MKGATRNDNKSVMFFIDPNKFLRSLRSGSERVEFIAVDAVVTNFVSLVNVCGYSQVSTLKQFGNLIDDCKHRQLKAE